MSPHTLVLKEFSLVYKNAREEAMISYKFLHTILKGKKAQCVLSWISINKLFAARELVLNFTAALEGLI